MNIKLKLSSLGPSSIWSFSKFVNLLLSTCKLDYFWHFIEEEKTFKRSCSIDWKFSFLPLDCAFCLDTNSIPSPRIWKSSSTSDDTEWINALGGSRFRFPLRNIVVDSKRRRIYSKFISNLWNDTVRKWSAGKLVLEIYENRVELLSSNIPVRKILRWQSHIKQMKQQKFYLDFSFCKIFQASQSLSL